MIDILDCTLRDGGYHTGWSFPDHIISGYFKVLPELQTSFVEVGFRHVNTQSNWGIYANLRDTEVDALPQIPNSRYGVMIKAGDFASPITDIPRLFSNKQGSRIELVRIASKYEELSAAISCSRHLKSLGYMTTINLTYVSTLSISQIKSAFCRVADFGLSYFYIADTIGNVTKAQLEATQDQSSTYALPWGFHGHDNYGLAMSNTLAAIDMGASIVDGTIFGMGLGAGNTKTELLCSLLKDVHVYETARFIEQRMVPLQMEYGWGHNMLYTLAAQKGLSPGESQKLMKSGSVSEILRRLRQ